MPLEAPTLDDRTFEDLVRELRLRIPRYTPEWTDHNESDPGITLIQLFAWLAETLLYRMNQVPERHYIKFLELLGLELEPARPALAHLTFQPAPGVRPAAVRRGTPVQSQPQGGGLPLVFETEEGLDPVPLALRDVQAYDGHAFTLLTGANDAAGIPYHPLGPTAQVGSALYLGFAGTGDEPTGEGLFPSQVRLRFFRPLAAGADVERARHDPPAVRLVWEAQSAPADSAWRPLKVFRDETLGLTQEGYVVLEGPRGIPRTAAGRLGEGEERYWIRCRLAEGHYEAGREPVVDFVRVNVVPALQLETVQDEVLGSSDGTPGQVFDLERRPVVTSSLELVLELADGEPELWERVDDFLASGPRDHHYTLLPTTGRLSFGDGRRGRIPPFGSTVVARHYRVGGGAEGNVGAHTVTSLLLEIQGVAGVTNERPAVGGRDEESVEEKKEKAPQVLRHRNRAVTVEDFAALAREVGGVADAAALPLHHPDYPEVDLPGAVTVILVPDSDERPPHPTAALLQAARQHLDRFRLVTTELYVRGPVFLPVSVHLEVAADPFAAFDAVAEDVRRALARFLDPRNQKLGADLYPTRLFELVLGVADVRQVTRLEVRSDGRTYLTEPVPVPRDGLVHGQDFDVRVVPLEERLG